MDKVVNRVVHYYRELGYNCAESTLHAANDVWELGLDDSVFKVMAGFGGGMGVKNVCGAVRGGIAALSYRYVQVTGHGCRIPGGQGI